jgi:uncharacterized protein
MPDTLDDSDLKLLSRVQQIVAQRLDGQQAGHGMDHVVRVQRTACQIQEEVGGDRLIIELAALLHDVGDAKFHDGMERSAEFTREILSELGVNADQIEQIAQIVDDISFRKGVDSEKLSLEGKIVQDADRIDALGAIGIVRTIEYGATKGQPFYVGDLNSTEKTGVGHFHDKLFKLHDMLNTEAAKRIAGQREQFMRDFLTQFLSEVGYPDEPDNATRSV